MRFDAVVVGGGPGGASAAIHLARAGQRVLVFDKARFPRDKCCGDGLTAGALRRLEGLGLQPASVPSWCEVGRVMVRSPSGRETAFPLPASGAYAAVAPRAELDAAVLDLARQAGAEVREGHAVTGAMVGDDSVVLTVEDHGTVEAPYVIAADGMWSPVRRFLGNAPESYLGEWHAFRQYFSGTGPAARDLWVWFDPDLLPGYAWSFPLPDGRANVGFGIRRAEGHATAVMAAQWRDLLDRPHVRRVLGPDAVAEGTHKAWPIPAALTSAPLTAGGGRVLYVGDAARATDPMTGEGIGQALETAEAAARAVVVAGPGAPVVASAVYERQVSGGLAVDVRLAEVLSRVLSHPIGARGAIRAAGLTDWTRRSFGRWLFEDYPRAVLATPRRWRAGMFTADGAFSGNGKQ